MRNILNKLKCRLGLHAWEYTSVIFKGFTFTNQTCKHCGKIKLDKRLVALYKIYKLK